MRTLFLTLIIITCASLPMAADVAINSSNFPDENFREYIDDTYDIWDDNILTQEEISRVTTMNVNGKNISSLVGIRFFTALKKLWCADNNLTNLDLSGLNNLIFLYCNENNIKGQAMTNLINNLVSYPAGSSTGNLYIVKCSNKEKNVITSTQVASAQAKGWYVNVYNEGSWRGYNGVFGDVNGDDVCNSADVTALYNWILNGDGSALKHRDQNYDNVVNAADVTKVYNIILGALPE